MSNNNQVTQITNMQDDFAQWYTDIVKKAELIEYTSIKGCMVLRPNGYAIWENIQKNLDEIFKQTNHENVYMPMFIPESLLQKEADHVDGFAPEVAWVTHAGNDKLAERMCIRPTSETLFCEHYANIIQSHRDLPKLYNQWCSVVRMEKTTRPFLRSSEFLWQEGHTVHATQEEAQQETEQMLNVYADFCRDFLAIPVLKGRKTEKEKFAGALHTYTIEALMRDGKSLQSGTSHNFGDGFAKAFGIQYTNKENKLAYPFQTSWGVSTRLIGALIMVHSDNRGLVLPPKIAPTQLVVIPVMQKKEGVIEKATEIQQRLSKVARTKIDTTDKSPGWKYSEYEMKGIPLRLEIGPKDIEANKCILVRRDNSEKIEVSLDKLEETVTQLLEDIQQSLLANATQYKEDNTHQATDWATFNTLADGTTGFIKAMWCESLECEDKIKEEVGLSSRCMPFEQEQLTDTCICCGKPATKMVVWGKAY